MKLLKHTPVFLFLLFITAGMSSCLIRVNGISNDYKTTNESQRKLIHEYASEEQRKAGHIYKLSGKQLKDELSKHEKSLVYIFKSGCNSQYCHPLSVYQNYATKNGYQLFLVLSGYSSLHISLYQNINEPFFAIDNEHYGTRYIGKGARFFENELLGRTPDFKKKEYPGNIYLFKGENLVSILRDLPKTPKGFSEFASPIEEKGGENEN